MLFCEVQVLQQRFRAGAIAANCHTGGVNGVCFAGEGHVVSWAKDGSARYWSLVDGTNVHLTGAPSYPTITLLYTVYTINLASTLLGFGIHVPQPS